jgi:hypothetical protein
LWRLVIRSQEKDPVRQASNSLNNKGRIMVHEAVARTNNSSSSLSLLLLTRHHLKLQLLAARLAVEVPRRVVRDKAAA